jgi:hypothetical protein
MRCSFIKAFSAPTANAFELAVEKAILGLDCGIGVGHRRWLRFTRAHPRQAGGDTVLPVQRRTRRLRGADAVGARRHVAFRRRGAGMAIGMASSASAASRPIPDILVIGKTPFIIQPCGAGSGSRTGRKGRSAMRKLIAFDDDTAAKLTQLARDRMATFQELADEAFADLLKKHGIPIDLKDALRKSARESGATAKVIPLSKRPKKR